MLCRRVFETFPMHRANHPVVCQASTLFAAVSMKKKNSKVRLNAHSNQSPADILVSLEAISNAEIENLSLLPTATSMDDFKG